MDALGNRMLDDVEMEFEEFVDTVVAAVQAHSPTNYLAVFAQFLGEITTILVDKGDIACRSNNPAFRRLVFDPIIMYADDKIECGQLLSLVALELTTHIALTYMR